MGRREPEMTSQIDLSRPISYTRSVDVFLESPTVQGFLTVVVMAGISQRWSNFGILG
jgi:hypothetical protein